MTSGESDETLVAQARAGDETAFARLIDRHYARIHRIAWRYCGNADDAEDIAQDVCIALGRAIQGYRGDGAFTSWLYRMTMNRAHDLHRSRAKQAKAIGAMAVIAEPACTSPPDARADDDALWAAVRDLPERQRESVLLVYAEGMSHSEAADVLQCREATVSWHIHEAKKRLKRVFEAEHHA